MVAVFTIGIIGFALDRIMHSLQNLFSFQKLKDAAMNAAQAKIIELSMHKHATVSPANDPIKPLVELKNVCKSYGEGNSRTSILKDIDLDIKEGEFIAIVGFSGSGKPRWCR